MSISRLTFILAMIVGAVHLSGCANTARGAVKDVTSTVDAAVE
nr:entericidin B signal peptide protein [Mesorhizobium sp.]